MDRRRRYMQIAAQVHREWAAEVAAGPLPFNPDDYPDHSDYNVEQVDMEATGEQLDDLNRRILEAVTAEGLADLHPPQLPPSG